jgi:dTDP-4-amino-4,6-dideoxygalactose transaminase
MSTRSVPFFNYPYVFTSHEEDFIAIFRDVGKRGAFIAQRDLHDFEQHLARFTGARHVLGFSNATDGLHIALRAAGIGPGDEVIFCSHTMVATAAAIYFAGATPVPVECGPDHLMDPASAAAAVTPRTRALMPTQLNGRSCDMDALQALADSHDLLIVEDAAQALGSKYKGRQSGTFGVASAISFYPAKNLGCLGDGGAVLTNDYKIHRKMFLLRDHGRDEAGDVVMWGLNTRLDNLQAAILDFKLARYDDETGRRREIARLYQERLGGVTQLVLPPAPDSEPDHFDVFQNYEIEADRRDDLLAYLKENGIGTLIQWGGKAVHQFEKLGLNVRLPYTERMFTRCLMLPMNTSLSDEDVDYVAAIVRQFYASQ